MKRLPVFFLLLFLKPLLFAQSPISLSADSDTTFWYGYKNADVKQFELGFVEQDTIAYSFRFWAPGMVVKVTKDRSQSFGDIIRFVEAYPNAIKKTFKKHYELSSSEANRIIYLIDSLQLESLPSDKNISGWQQGLDGVTYFIEYKKGNQYSFKNYWAPTSQDSLKEAIQLQNFINALERTLDLKRNNSKFQAAIPFDGWTLPGSSSAVIRVKSKAKKKDRR